MKTTYRIILTPIIFFGLTYGAYAVGKYIYEKYLIPHLSIERDPGIFLHWLDGIMFMMVIACLIFLAFHLSKTIIK